MKQSRLINVLFVAPVWFAFIMIIIIPFFFGLYYSMTDWNGVNNTVSFIGSRISRPCFPHRIPLFLFNHHRVHRHQYRPWSIS